MELGARAGRRRPAGQQGTPEGDFGVVQRGRYVDTHLVEPAAAHHGWPYRLPVPGHGAEQLPGGRPQYGPSLVLGGDPRTPPKRRLHEFRYVVHGEVEMRAAGARADPLDLHAGVGAAVRQQCHELPPFTPEFGQPRVRHRGPEGVGPARRTRRGRSTKA